MFVIELFGSCLYGYIFYYEIYGNLAYFGSCEIYNQGGTIFIQKTADKLSPFD